VEHHIKLHLKGLKTKRINVLLVITMNDEDKEVRVSGYSVGKWSDDDDWHPITPFRGNLR
jgi:hypothetical protein